MEQNNRYVKLLLFPVGQEEYILVYGFSTKTNQKTYPWRKRKVLKAQQIICHAILTSGETEEFEHELTIPGKITVGTTVLLSPQLIKRSTVLYNTGDHAEKNPASKCGQLIEFWKIHKEVYLKQIQAALQTEGKQLYRDTQSLLAWVKQECGINFSIEGWRFGNYEHYEISPFASNFDIDFHKELDLKQVTVKKSTSVEKDVIVNCTAYHCERCLINKTTLLPADKFELIFCADEPMSRAIVNVWEIESGDLIYTSDITLIMEINIGMRISSSPFLLKERWAKRLLNSASNRRSEIEQKIQMVQRISSEDAFHVRGDSRNCIDEASSSANLLFAPYKKHKNQGAFIQNKGVDGEIESFLKIMEYIDQTSVKEVIIADPYFSIPTAAKMLGRIKRTDIRITILTSLCEIDPDTGTGTDIRTKHKAFLQENAYLLPPNLSICNLQRGKKQVFHDRYLLRVHSDGEMDGFLLSNSLNSMGQLYPFVIAPLEHEVCIDVFDYLNQMRDPAIQAQMDKGMQIDCDVWYDSNTEKHITNSSIKEVPPLSEWIGQWCDTNGRISVTEHELSQVLPAVWSRWDTQKENACLVLCMLGTIQDPWDARHLARELQHIDCAVDAFLSEFSVLAAQAEKKQNHARKGIHSDEHMIWAMLSGNAQPDRQGFHLLFEQAGHIWYSGDSWLTGGYRLMLALDLVRYVELLKKSSSPLMFDVLAAHMLFYPWSASIFRALTESEKLCLQILAAEGMFFKYSHGELDANEIIELFSYVSPKMRIFPIAHLLSKITFYNRVVNHQKQLPSSCSTFIQELLQCCAKDFERCTEEIRSSVLYWLNDCEECSCCSLHLSLAERISNIEAKHQVLDQAVCIIKKSLFQCSYERDLSRNIALLLSALEHRYGPEVERYLLGKIVDWEVFERASEPERKTYSYNDWHSAHIRAQWQISLLRSFYTLHPDAEKTANWLKEWESRVAEQ